MGGPLAAPDALAPDHFLTEEYFENPAAVLARRGSSFS
jgi:hypothetical protein